MEVRFVNVDEADFLLTNLGKERLEFLDESRSFRGIRLLEHFLAFLPAQIVLLQQLAQSPATDIKLQNMFDPTPDFLDCPVVPGQLVDDRLAFLYGCDELTDLLLGKRGGWPPLCR